jgi:hypothetical protein
MSPIFEVGVVAFADPEAAGRDANGRFSVHTYSEQTRRTPEVAAAGRPPSPG